MSAIITHNLAKNFGGTAAVRALNLEVQQGSIYGFLGPNGSGKTTTVKMLLGMKAPSSGDATVLGFDSRLHSVEICKRIGYVPENGNLYPFMTVGETISLVKSLRPTWDTVLSKRLLDTFHLPLDRKVGKLSKGMQRQLALALAMAPRPELLILDEPTSGLDPVKQHEFLQILMDNVAETGQTVFFSSHNMSEVERAADTVGIIYEGRLVVTGNLEELKMKVKRIRVVLPNASHLTLTSPVRKIEGGQGQWLITVDQGADDIMSELRKLHPTVLEAYDLSLEDVFMIYAGGDAK